MPTRTRRNIILVILGTIVVFSMVALILPTSLGPLASCAIAFLFIAVSLFFWQATLNLAPKWSGVKSFLMSLFSKKIFWAIIAIVFIVVAYNNANYDKSKTTSPALNPNQAFKEKLMQVQEETPFWLDKEMHTMSNQKADAGEILNCPEKPISPDNRPPILHCMRKDQNGLFYNGEWGFFPLSRLASYELGERGEESSKTIDDFNRLEAENNQLKIQLRQLQSNLTSRITNLESQLAKRDRENGELRSQLVQAQQAQQVAQQAQRQAEQGWAGAESRAEYWERIAKTVGRQCGVYHGN